jgi:hypothetical protein
MSKVEAYFGKVQRVNEAFTEKLLSYFDDTLATARTSPQHLVMALRVVVHQHSAWQQVLARGEAAAAAANANATAEVGSNPWGILYREEVMTRMSRYAARQMQPVLLEADRVRVLVALTAREGGIRRNADTLLVNRAVWEGRLPLVPVSTKSQGAAVASRNCAVVVLVDACGRLTASVTSRDAGAGV